MTWWQWLIYAVFALNVGIGVGLLISYWVERREQQGRRPRRPGDDDLT